MSSANMTTVPTNIDDREEWA